jgi:hypothetical protein
MAFWPRTGLPNVSISIFGIVSAICFFAPGLKYYLQRRRLEAAIRPPPIPDRQVSRES